MKTNEFKKAIDGLNTSDISNLYCSESVDDISVWYRSNDDKGNIMNTRLVNISKKISNDYVFFTKSNNYSNSNMQIDIIVRKGFIDLINDYASTPLEEREDNEDKIKSMQETIDDLNARNYRLESMLDRLDPIHSPTIHFLNNPNEDLPKSVKIDSRLEALEHFMNIIKNKKPRWFD